MHFSALLVMFLHTFWYLIPFLVVVILLKSPWFNGAVGEFAINTSIKHSLDPKKFHLLKNVTIPCDDGTTQIDHVVVSEFGVFVLETKNMKGWIFGHERQKMWTQQIFEHSIKFQNPLYQNYKHVKTLQELLGLTNEQIHSLIVFVGDSTFKTEMPENVTQGKGYLKFIRSKSNVVLSEDEVCEIIGKIEHERLEPSLKTHFEHVRHVKQIINEKQKTHDSIEKNRAIQPSTASEKFCPKCGSEMILRQTKKGEYRGQNFWGCSQFPKCRSVESV